MYRMRFHGRGGQGMKTASRILGTAFFLEGFDVQDAPRYGAERRGAPLFAFVRAAREPIDERGIIRHPDLVIVADDTLVPVPAAGCMTLLSVYPFTPFRGSWLYTAMASAPAGAQGIRDALDILIKKGRLSPDEDLEAVVLTGDGAAYGMGLSATSGAIERGLDFLYICYDNEGYGNTGQQYSAATPHGAITSTSKGPRGYPGYKKDLFAIWAANKPAYVATVVGAEPVDLARKVEKAKRIQGPRLLIALAPCPTGWDFDPKESVEIGKLAVKTGIWPLKEYVDGRVIHTKVPRQRVPVEEYLKRQGRFAHLFSPGRDEALLTEIQARVDTYWTAVAESPGPQEGA